MPSAPAAGASWVADRVLASNQELGAYRVLSPLRAVVETAGTVAYLAPERFEGRLPLHSAPAVAPALRSGGGRQPRVHEDHVDAADSLREALELAGHEVEVACNGIEGPS